MIDEFEKDCGDMTDRIVSGARVRCISVDEVQSRWGNCDNAHEHLTVGNEYTVEKVDVHSWHTKVFLKEIPGKAFNSVQFTIVD